MPGRPDPESDPLGELVSLVRGRAVAISGVYGLPDGSIDDLVQIARIKIWRRSDRYNPDLGPWKPWAYQVANRAMIDHARSLGRRVAPEVPLPESAPFGVVEEDEAAAQRRLQERFSQLPERDRELLKRKAAGWLLRELAEEMSVTVSSMGERYRKALERLK